MHRRWLIGSIVLIITALGSLTVFIRENTGLSSIIDSPRYGNEQPSKDERIIGSVVAKKWAHNMVQKYPYEPGTYSGVKPTSSYVMVWVMGRRVISNEIPTSGYFIVKNDRLELTARLPDNTPFTVQDGDNLESNKKPQNIAPNEVLFGDYVAVRTTYVVDLPLILEVRKLNRIVVDTL